VWWERLTPIHEKSLQTAEYNDAHPEKRREEKRRKREGETVERSGVGGSGRGSINGRLLLQKLVFCFALPPTHY